MPPLSTTATAMNFVENGVRQRCGMKMIKKPKNKYRDKVRNAKEYEQQ
jgi:hypothetical protein